MDIKESQIVMGLLGVILGLAAGYGLGGWMEYRKGFESGIQTTLALANSIAVSPKNE